MVSRDRSTNTFRKDTLHRIGLSAVPDAVSLMTTVLPMLVYFQGGVFYTLFVVYLSYVRRGIGDVTHTQK